MAIFLKEYAHTHTHFRAAGCSQLNGSTVLKSRIEYVRLGLVVLLLLFAVSWLPAGFTCQGPNVDYLLTSRRICSNRDYGMDPGWHCISYTTNTKASPSNETLQGNFIALDCTLLWERDESNTTAMYHHRFGYTLWERNKHNIEEMKNKHKYKTLIKIRNIVNNRFYPLTVAWRKNIWAEQVRSQCCMMYVDLSVTHGRVLTGALTFSRQCRVDQQ